MKGKRLTSLLVSLFILWAAFLPFAVNAQGTLGGGGGSVGDPACDPQCNCRPDMSICPIDTYVYVLLGIGVLYGVWKGKGKSVRSS